jgi:hypothetical protein
VEHTATKPDIPESALEHVIEFANHWVDKWTIPNPFVSPFYDGLQKWNVTLADFAFAADTKNASETALIISVSKLRSTIVVGLNKLIFRTANPDWDMAPNLVELFDTSLSILQSTIEVPIKGQECTIVFHVTPGDLDLATKTAALVSKDRIVEAEFYGVSAYSELTSMAMERSLKYQRGLFFRLTRKFDSSSRFADIALALYHDEVAALSMLDIKDLV